MTSMAEKTVCVLGIPSGLLDPEILRPYFDQLDYPTSEIKIDKQNCRAFITFESLDVASRVLEKNHFLFLDHIITVVSSEPVMQRTDMRTSLADHWAPSAGHGAPSVVHVASDGVHGAYSGNNVVVLENISPDTDADILEMLIDNPRKGIMMEGRMDIRMNHQTSSATVTFTNVEDAKKLVEKKSLTFNKEIIKVKQPTNLKPNSGAILVTRITPQLDEETLEMYFSNPKKSHGDDIKEFKLYEPDKGFAVIVYKNPAVAERVVEMKNHELFQHRLKVEPWDPSSEYQNLKNTDNLSSPLSPGQNIHPKALLYEAPTPVMSSSVASSAGMVSIIRSGSENEKMLKDDIMSTTHHSLFNKLLVKKKQESDEGDIDDIQQNCAILVEGISQKSKEDTVRKFFKKIAGGKIESLICCEDGSYIITFKDRAGVDRVLKRDKLKLDGSHLVVKEMTAAAMGTRVQGPAEPCMLYIWGDLTKLSKDALELCLVAGADAGVDKVIYSTNKDVALVHFRKKPDYVKLKQTMERKPVEGEILRVTKVPCSATIQVHSASDLQCYLLQLYFENKDRSGGSGQVKVKQLSSSVYLVHFENPAIAEAVLERNHKLDKDELQVSIYRAELGLIPPGYDTSQPPVKIPTHVIVSNLDPLKVTHLKSSNVALNMANTYLQKLNAEIKLAQLAKDELKIICKLTAETENWRYLAETWTKKSVNAINEIVNGFEVENIVCLPMYWDEICMHVKTYKQEKENKMNLISVVGNPENHVLHIIGPLNSIAGIVKDIKEICQDVQERQEQVIDEVKASAAKLEVLVKMDVPMKMKQRFEKFKIQVDIKNEKLLMQGIPNDIRKAIKQVYDTLNGITEVEVATSNLVVNIVSSTEGWKYVTDMLKANNLVTVIECGKNKLFISGPGDQCKQTEDLLKKGIIENEIPIDEDSRPALQGNEWDVFVQEHTSTHPGRLILQATQDLSTLTVVTTSDLEDAIKEHIATYLKDHTVKKQRVPVSKGCLKLLTNHAQDKIKQIESHFRQYEVKIQCSHNGLIVQGILDGFTHAVEEVMILTTDVVHHTREITEPGLYTVLMQPQSSHMITGIENNYKVIIEKQDKTREQERQRYQQAAKFQEQFDTLHSVLTTQGVIIKVFIGDLTEHTADAIVNPANCRLDHCGGLAGALAKKGGRSIQDESDAYIKRNGQLEVGEAIIADAGSLNCKGIIHTVGPRWAGGSNGEEDLLWNCVYNSLELAQTADMRSVAFPLISSGIFGVPIQVSAESIVTAIFDYLCTTDDIDITEIHLVDQDRSKAEAFVKVLNEKYGTSVKPQNTSIISTQAETRVMQGARPKKKSEVRKSLASRGSNGRLVDSHTYVTPSRLTIKIVIGEIAKQRTDAIMNSIPSTVDLSSGALSSSIMNAMNSSNQQALQAEAKQKAPNGLQEGDVITTAAGNLASNMIFHVVLPSWKNATSKKYLENALDKVLTQAHQAGLTSLALPSVGTGNLNWPNDIVAKTMFDAIIQFSQKHPGTSLTAVNLVVYPRDQASITAFESYIQTLVSRQTTESRGKRKLASSIPTGWQSFEEVVDEGAGSYGTLSSTPITRELQIRDVKVQVTIGDITMETTDAIISCTKPSGGTKQGLEVKGPGNMKVKCVIQLDSSYFSDNWKEMILSCLQEADRLRLFSVTFPDLGTGHLSQTPAYMATYMVEAISDFIKTKPQHLRLVRVVMSQSHMVTAYYDQMKAANKISTSKWSATLSKVKKIMRFGEQQNTSIPSYYTGATSRNTDMHITLGVYGFTKDSISQALDAIDQLWQENREDKTLGGDKDSKLKEIIKKLSPEQAEKIEKMGARKNVNVLIRPKGKAACIQIQGYIRDVAEVETSIREYLHELELEEQQRQEAQRLCQFVQWEFEERPGKFIPYPKDINIIIEKAYSQGKTTERWQEELEDGGNTTIEINFKNNTETDLMTKDSCKFRRRDKSKQDAKLPDNWAPMQPTDRFIRVPLNPTGKEYTVIEKAFMQTARNHTILKIERVQNPGLYRRYEVHKLDMQQKKPKIKAEQLLWHGTSIATVNKINCNGFNRSYCGKNGVVYGKGVYFARDASYSVGFAPKDDNGECRMYYASVLTGEYTLGNSTMLEPPAKNANEPNILYDSTVNDIENPSIFAVYYDSQAYPHYCITFK